MIIEAARLAIANLLAPQTRTVFWKVLGITLLVLVALWSALHGALVSFALPWLEAFFPNIPSWAAAFAGDRADRRALSR
jgi:CysZ protein